MRRLLAIAAVLMLTGAAGSEPEARVQLPPAMAAQCQLEGGCEIWSKERFVAELRMAWEDGKRSGMREAAKSCGRAS